MGGFLRRGSGPNVFPHVMAHVRPHVLTAASGPSYTGPYSSLTTSPVIAAGFKRLHAGYSGSLVRLLRDSDDAEMDFGYDADGDLDTAAIATWLGGSTGYGAKWYNQYTAGEDYVQATKANMPTFNPTGLNGGPCFTFDGSNDYLEASITAITGTTLFNAALCRPLSGASNNDGVAPAYDSSQASDFNVVQAMSLEYGGPGGPPAATASRNGQAARLGDAAAAIDSNAVYTARAVADGHYGGVNGSESSKATSSGNFNVNRHLLAGRWVASARSNFLHGSIAGVALFNVDPGTTDRGVVIDYLKSVGGIA